MSLHMIGRHRSPSQVSSGRSTPVPRVSKRAIEDDMIGADKGLRKYAVSIERVLSSWEVSPEEWADYIAFLARLLKAIQAHPTSTPILPHSFEVASKLAQCLNPALPSGVHQKALDLYSYIFATFGQGWLAGHLHEFLPGLASVLSFASLSTRPLLYEIYEEHVVQLPKIDLRSVLKSLVLSLLPALEEETSEDFDRAFHILESLQRAFSPDSGEQLSDSDKDGYFWQCLFLAVITSPARRQGALNYLSQKLPKFVSPPQASSTDGILGSQNPTSELPATLQLLLSPEPGLLIRCFAAALSDSQVLIQRGFLDLLVTHIPLHSPVFRSQVREEDVDRIVTAALKVLLRREMSLNRRLWSWFLGPSPSDTNGRQPSASSNSKRTNEETTDRQYTYFTTYGKASLERSVQAMFRSTSSNPVDAARPFRICLSLMYRWEMGGSIVPRIFLPAMQNAYRYSLDATATDSAEVIRSASLFFDGVESMLIWANLLRLLRDSSSATSGDGIPMFAWIVNHFNIKDEEMVTTHIPITVMYILSLMVESTPQVKGEHRLHAILLRLLELIPERAFSSPLTNGSKTSSHSAISTSPQLRSKIEDFYQTQNQVSTDDSYFSSRDMASIVPQLAISYAMKALHQQSDGHFSQALALLVILRSKITQWPADAMRGLYEGIINSLESSTDDDDDTWAFSDIIATAGLLNTSHRNDKGPVSIAVLEPLLYSQLWRFLSPNRPKYHVEAVKAIWQLHDSSKVSGLAEASLTGLVRGIRADGSRTSCDQGESIRRFTILWNHTIPQISSAAGPTGSLRRRTTAASISDLKQSDERELILTTPLMLILDTLSDQFDPAFDVVRSWIMDGSSLDRIIQIHFDLVHIPRSTAVKHAVEDGNGTERDSRDRLRNIGYTLAHFLDILRFANNRVWKCLETTLQSSANQAAPESGLVNLTNLCLELVTDSPPRHEGLQQKSLDVLQIILSCPIAGSLKQLHIETRLLEHLMKMVNEHRSRIQGPLLNVTSQALRLAMIDDDTNETTSNESRSSLSVQRPVAADVPRGTRGSPVPSAQQPPPQLLTCLKLAFSSQSTRPFLDQWLRFFMDVLPMFTEAIFANLIPLVECFCKELYNIHGEMLSLSRASSALRSTAPEASALMFLEALEQVLAVAHNCLVAEGSGDAEMKAVPQPRSVFGNMTAGVFKTESVPNRMTQTNSRLTVILALQDVVRVSIQLWTWCSHFADVEDYDKSSNATTAYNAARIRNRTRHLLEETFNTEELESLEVIIHTWSYSEDPVDADATLELIHVVPGLRPKTVIPALLDALCSRTNLAALPPSRQSSQTLDLTALDIVWFMQAYLRSIEDDAMDEIWSDCMAFIRDVLANPLPYRQVLPALLSMTLLLAQKMDNTNFGEQRKMRRELGDAFSRLLTATLTTSSSASMDTAPEDSDELRLKTHAARGRREMSLPAVLREVTANVDIIMESQDRSTAAINSVITSVISPLLRAKSFPDNMNSDTLATLQNVAKKSSNSKIWKREISDAFNDPRILSCSPATMERDWFPIFHEWIVTDRERMPELTSRLTAPSSAGIMFGVGASAARLEADRKAQLTLRRICILLLASPQDTFVLQLRDMWEKIVELLAASVSSSPSIAVKAEVFMLCRALALTAGPVHLSPFWPVVNHSLQSALSSVILDAPAGHAFGNLAMLQACKLLDLLVALSPDDFQLHEWLYISDTVDAVYQPPEWQPSALSDQVAERLSADTGDEGTNIAAPTPVSSSNTGRRRPLIDSDVNVDKSDYKAMGRDDFARLVLRPFLSQFSIHAYEAVYRMEPIDTSVWRRNLLEDLLDLHTVVE